MVNHTKKKSILGGTGGLDALFSEQIVEPVVTAQDTVQELAVSQLVANRFQPRRVFEADALAELAASIEENGVLQPIIARRHPEENQRYEILAGERRFRASKLAGLKTVPVVLREFNDEQMLQAAVLENLQREDLTPLEEAQAYREMMDVLHLTQDQVAKRLGKGRSGVANLLRLLNLPDAVKDMLNAGTLSMGQARTLLGLRNKRRITPVANRAVKEGLTVRQLEQLVNKLNDQGEAPSQTKQTDARLQQTMQLLEAKFGTKVNVTRNRKGAGKIEIAYLSDADLTRIFDVLDLNAADD